MRETLNHQLNIGDSIQIKHRLMDRVELLYAGMPNKETFSLVVIRRRGHQAPAYNLYVPINQRHLNIAEVPVAIHVSAPPPSKSALTRRLVIAATHEILEPYTLRCGTSQRAAIPPTPGEVSLVPAG